SRKQHAQAAHPAGNQVDPIVSERDRRRVLVERYLLPPYDLPRALFVFDQRLRSAALLVLQVPGQFVGSHVSWDDEELPAHLRVFQRRRLQQSRQSRQQRGVLFGNDDLDEHLAGGLGLKNGLDSFEARQRVVAIPLGDRLVRPCLQWHAVAMRKQGLQFPAGGSREVTKNDVVFVGLDATGGRFSPLLPP